MFRIVTQVSLLAYEEDAELDELEEVKGCAPPPNSRVPAVLTVPAVPATATAAPPPPQDRPSTVTPRGLAGP